MTDVANDGIVGWPKDLPPIYNASHDPCDMLYGACICGAWHRSDEKAREQWIVEHRRNSDV